ncbi:metacaspase-3-like [Bidens hawaiensis]|uniref:metacaspase-3-like n=1 Tax=Bidens hawaiensis TaxID=980011 RepID=UPI0040494B14
MATTTRPCKTCGKNLMQMPGSQNESCPRCQTVNLFNQTIKPRVLFRVGRFINAAANKYQQDLQQPPPNGSAPQSAQLPQSRSFQQQLSQKYGRKRAVLCGITYNGQKKKLEASVHNVKSMHQLLVNKLGFPNVKR